MHTEVNGDAVPTLELEEPGGRGPWRLVLTGPGFTRSVVLRFGEGLTLGSRGGSQVVIEDAAVSGAHARVTATSTGVVVEDLGSKNGLFVGGARVTRAVLGGGHGQFVIGRTTVRVEADSDRAPQAPVLLPGLIGSSAPMRRLAQDVQRVAVLDAPVLLLGESGTGKDVVARAIHNLSGRRGRYVPLNA